ncbi:hypothetical protein BJV78DRAFT_132243 [Lactifluus subvellereus]|nr:hypothetical protein BJV78DRAFT_132243 [Lactifluus subvellereus]
MLSVTSVLQQPRLQPYPTRSSTTGGILLNPSPNHRQFSLPLSSYPSRSNQSLSSSTSSSDDVNTPPSSAQATPSSSLNNTLTLPCTSDDDHVPRPRSGSAPDSGSRRIRFAPLPDPRRAILVTEHGPLSSVFDDDDPNGIPRPDLRSFPTSHASSLLLGDGVVTSKELPAIVTSGPSSPRRQCIRPSVSSSPSPVLARPANSPTPSTATVTPAGPLPSTPSTRFAKRLLYPFRQKADCSRRSGSRDSSPSRDDASPSWGIPLCNWTSADADSQSSTTNGAPLARVQSATSAKPSKPKRLLNGRVYGARNRPHNQSTNVFDNIPDDEPEFVEWGHGGMGSVRAGGIWAKVQSDQKLLIGHIEEQGRRGFPESPADDDYDGTGMGWVKKRREERERKKREEQAACESAGKVDALSAPSLVSTPASANTDASTHISAHHDIITPMQARSEDDDDYYDDEDEEVVKAIWLTTSRAARNKTMMLPRFLLSVSVMMQITNGIPVP